MSPALPVRVRTIQDLTPRIRLFELVSLERGAVLPPFSAGAHVAVHLPSGLKRQYSLCNDPSERSRYVLGVQREEAGRGGSAEMHAHIHVGDVITVDEPVNRFRLSPEARRSLLIAGGIGITPILAMGRALARQDADFRILYLTRSAEETAFLDDLAGPALQPRLTVHHDDGDPRRQYDLAAFLSDFRDGTHLYCCGPKGLMAAVERASSSWPLGTVHFEHFSNADASPQAADQPFTVKLARSGTAFEVPAGQTILGVLLQAGFDVDYSCGEGTCGTCIVPLLEGEADHRDTVLTDGEKSSSITICCSRARTPAITIDL